MLSAGRRLRGDVKDIVFNDAYHLRGYAPTHFNHIIDIGANIGMFSVMARMLYPTASVIAVEPFAQTYAYLFQNVQHLNIITHNFALGNGQSFDVKDDFGSCRTANSLQPKEGGKFESKTLAQIFEFHKIKLTDKYFIKIDCEGAERYLVGDKASEAILRSAECVAMEVHYSINDINSDLPVWQVYQNWIDTFKPQMVVQYRGKSGRGVGTYILTKRTPSYDEVCNSH